MGTPVLQDSVTRSAGTQDPEPDGPPGSEAAVYHGLRVMPPLTAVVELAAIVGLLLAVDWLWPALDILNLQPSPFWIPVLLLSLQYGTASGTLAVLVAIAAYFAYVTLPEQGVGENEFAYRLRILAQPILWIAAAVLLGQFRMVQIAAKRELSRRVSELETQRATLADYANRLRTRCDALEREIATRPLNAAAPLMSALAVLRSDEAASPAAIERCLTSAFPGAAISLFLRQGSALNKVVSSGWPSDAAWLTVIGADHPLHQGIVSGGKRVCVLDAGDDITLAGQGLAAVPVIEPRTQRVLGMVKIEQAGSHVVTASLLAELEVLAAAIEPALADAAGLVSIAPASEGAGAVASIAALRQPARLVVPAAGEEGIGEAWPVRPKVSR
jgi:polysaccharide biosynthesis protein PelD